MSRWFEQTDCTGSNVVYSRVRLARNWDEYVFPGKLDTALSPVSYTHLTMTDV